MGWILFSPSFQTKTLQSMLGSDGDQSTEHNVYKLFKPKDANWKPAVMFSVAHSVICIFKKLLTFEKLDSSHKNPNFYLFLKKIRKSGNTGAIFSCGNDCSEWTKAVPINWDMHSLGSHIYHHALFPPLLLPCGWISGTVYLYIWTTVFCQKRRWNISPIYA